MGHRSGGWWIYFRAVDDERPQVTWPLLKRVATYARPYRGRIALLLATILVTTGLGLLTPLILRDLIDNTLPSGNRQRLNLLAAGLIAIPLISGAIRVWQRHLNATIGEGVIYDLRSNLFAHLQKMSLRFFTHTRTGELMSRLNNDVVGAQRAISNTIVDIVTNLIQVIATLAVMFTLEWRLTLLGLVVLPIFIVAARRIGGRLREIQRETMDLNAQMNAMMNETLNVSGALLVKLFGRTRTETDRFDNRAARVRDMGVHRAVIASGFFVLLGLVGAVGTALVYWLGGHLVLRDVFTIGEIVAFSAYLTQLYGALQSLTNAPVDFATSIVSFERVFEVIDLPLDIEEKPDALSLPTVEGRLTFDDVTFRYDAADMAILRDVERHGKMENVRAVLSGDEPRPVRSADTSGDGAETSQARTNALEDVSFEIEPGQLVALVGPSGAGKTTLTYLIPRLYDPDEGRILLDGHDLRDLTLETLAEHIGMVTQETYLFHDTIRTNLLYANLDATQAEIEAACRAANIHQFISELPDGYDTVVGERGYRLSGGEKQRLAIARVILKDPRILILDEATASVDTETEQRIQQALERLLAGRTSLVIAHRLSTVRDADRIHVLHRGRIVESGRHEELLAQRGVYDRLYRLQYATQETGAAAAS